MTSSKHAKPVLWLLTAILAVSMLSACSDSKPKSEGDKMNPSPAPVAVPAVPVDSPAKKVDSLPPLDRKAKGKPENGNT